MSDHSRRNVLWVVTRGSYEEYRAADTEQRAAAIAAAGNAAAEADGDHGPYQVDTLPYFGRMPERLTVHRVTVDLPDAFDGTLHGLAAIHPDRGVHSRVEWEHELAAADTLPARWRWVRAPAHNGAGGRLEVTGTDERLVHGVFAQQLALLLAGSPVRRHREVVEDYPCCPQGHQLTWGRTHCTAPAVVDGECVGETCIPCCPCLCIPVTGVAPEPGGTEVQC
ncbi:MAG TPA: hypothetical protein VGD67_21750 [Pseudonocardiaceae bacterium]